MFRSCHFTYPSFNGSQLFPDNIKLWLNKVFSFSTDFISLPRKGERSFLASLSPIFNQIKIDDTSSRGTKQHMKKPTVCCQMKNTSNYMLVDEFLANVPKEMARN